MLINLCIYQVSYWRWLFTMGVILGNLESLHLQNVIATLIDFRVFTFLMYSILNSMFYMYYIQYYLLLFAYWQVSVRRGFYHSRHYTLSQYLDGDCLNHRRKCKIFKNFPGVRTGSNFSTREVSGKPTEDDLTNTRLTQKQRSGWVIFKCQKVLWIFH